MSERAQKENSLLLAYKKGAEILRNADPDRICSLTGAVFKNNSFKIRFINAVYEISTPDISFTTGNLPTIAEVLILHYLTSIYRTGGKVHKKGDFVSFSSIPGGMFYYKSFKGRTLDKLLSHFESIPEKLPEAAAVLGGTGRADHSSLIPVFPKIDLVVQIYPGDDEFPAEANILFPDDIVNFLPVEDIAFLGGYLVQTLIRV